VRASKFDGDGAPNAAAGAGYDGDRFHDAVSAATVTRFVIDRGFFRKQKAHGQKEHSPWLPDGPH